LGWIGAAARNSQFRIHNSQLSPPLADLLTLGSRWTLVGGKGGVGKTTTAAALAVELADRGEPTLVLSVDPAHSLGDALGVPLGNEPTPLPGLPALHAMEVDAEYERVRFLESRRAPLLQLVERGTYLERSDAAGFIDLAVPGMDELAAVSRLLELTRESRRVVIDTAPTGHTLRLLELPALARGWLGALEAMQAKHRSVALALTGAVGSDCASVMLDDLAAELDRLDAMLHAPERTRFVLVSTAEPVVLAETRRYQELLTRRGIALGGIVVNRAGPEVPGERGGGMVFVPPLDVELRGPEGLRAFGAAASAAPAAPEPAPRGSGRLEVGAPFTLPAGRTLHLVGGKGGVGKSTAACALAVRLAVERAGPDGPVLLLGTDPAGSLGDVLGVEVGGETVEVPGVPGLLAHELDAEAVWDAFRAEYRAEAERLFEGLLGGLSATADRAVVERLIDLAPPGLDELMALLEVVERLEEGHYAALVLDTAPTGHLLRLLEMPELALQWTHQLMRLLLKYREVVGLGGLAERVLRLAHTLRGLLALLRDRERTWLLLVALPESLSVPETARLADRLQAMEILPGALLVNRLLDERGDAPPSPRAEELLRAVPEIAAYAAPARTAGPTGAAELERFLTEWRGLGLAAEPSRS
jgi:arsenite/tail-anchored protein-transporting ATPase